MRRYVAMVALTALATASAAVIACPPAAAQQAAPTGRATDIDVIGQILYDSNVARSGETVARERGLQKQDVILTPSVLINVARPVGREIVYLSGSAGYDFYARNRILNRERVDLRGGVDGRLGPCQGGITGTYSRHQNDLQELNLVATRNVEDHESIGLNEACGRSIGLAPTFSVQEDWLSDSAPALRLAGYRSFSATAGLAYRRPTFGSLSVYGNFVRSRFPDQLLFGVIRIPQGYDLHAGGIRYDRNIGARILGELSASYTQIKPFAPGAPGFSGFTYAADLTYRATSRLSAHFNFHRAVTPSNRGGSTFNLERGELIQASYRASPRLSVGLGASQSERLFSGAILNPLLDLSHERVRAIFTTLDYTLSRRFSLHLNVQHEERGANLAGFGYADTRVGFSARAHF